MGAGQNALVWKTQSRGGNSPLTIMSSNSLMGYLIASTLDSVALGVLMPKEEFFHLGIQWKIPLNRAITAARSCWGSHAKTKRQGQGSQEWQGWLVLKWSWSPAGTAHSQWLTDAETQKTGPFASRDSSVPRSSHCDLAPVYYLRSHPRLVFSFPILLYSLPPNFHLRKSHPRLSKFLFQGLLLGNPS